MIKVLIVGGKLQGIEVVYLTNKAGYYSILIDKNNDAPASALANRFVLGDIFNENKLIELFKEVDIVIPAIENIKVLDKLIEYGEKTGTKVIFDKKAYLISSSKKLSNELFEKLDLPLPKKYPQCGYPVVIKPDSLSGSTNVYRANSKAEVQRIINTINTDLVIQEFLEGRSFSLEVIGDGEKYFYPQITEVVLDDYYDCKRIIAPAQITNEQEKQFYNIAEKIAKSIKINGIFDIEVICHNGVLKLLEIDARFPSQTPISVYHSCGINMVEMIVEMVLGTFKEIRKAKNRVCFYQQVVVNCSNIEVIGEHVIKDCKDLTLIEGFFGADEAITDYKDGKKNFTSIIITTADTHKGAYDKFCLCLNKLKELVNEGGGI